MAQGDVKAVRDFFGMGSADMIKEWKVLDEAEKNQIRGGILDGSLSY